jgi:catechol 2,3-dioxygenase-like lactoylglutathione lyase family enzyme
MIHLRVEKEAHMFDVGLTHVALPVSNMDASLAFYARFAHMQVVHRRTDRATGSDVVWISDRTRPFVIVLIHAARVEHPLLPLAHLGVACASREEIDRLCDQARTEGCLRYGPVDEGDPVGYLALLADPDGHTLEIAFGQAVEHVVVQAQ